MATIPLILGAAEQAAIRNLVERAVAEKRTYAQMLAMHAAFQRGEPTKADTRHLTIDIPTGYTVTYTIEEHQPATPYRHLSVSLTHGKPGRTPSPPAIQMIMEHFGFKLPLEGSHVWLEEYSQGFHAVNIIEPLSAVAGSPRPS